MIYDVIVIGSGPGGYIAAVRASQLGLKAAIVEKYKTLGGTCLNVGCIPSKALLDSSHHYEDAIKHFKDHGIDIPGEVKVNLEQMIARKQAVVDQTTSGIDFLMNKNKIEVYKGLGSFIDATHIKVHPHASGAVGGNQDMSRTKGGLTRNYMLPWMRMVCRSERLLRQVPLQIVHRPSH